MGSGMYNNFFYFSFASCGLHSDYIEMKYKTKEPGEEIIDCSVLGQAGHVITGDLNLLSKLVFHSDARYIIIVEKVTQYAMVYP